ncbi:UNVERIFIED_CONTAM: hypothetical protein HDU68_004215, partial [Siphonaria sp. JEL0065]
MSRDPHHSFPLPPGPELTSPVALGFKKVRPGHKLHIDTHNLSRSPTSAELPPLPKSPSPKHLVDQVPLKDGDDSQKRPSVAVKAAKLKVISPTTGAAVTVAETDLLKPSSSASKSRSASQRNSVSKDGSGEKQDIDGQSIAAENEAERSEKEEEEERIRELLSTSAAVTSHKKGKGRGSGNLAGTSANVFARAAENNIAPVMEAGDPDILFVD